MNCYLIGERLTECDISKLRAGQYVAVLTSDEWRESGEGFDLGIDMEAEFYDRHETKAISNVDSLTGSFLVPDRKNISEIQHSFTFALDEKGIIIIDDEGFARDMVKRLSQTKKWRLPSLERFIYDLLEEIVADDLNMLEAIEKRLDLAEKEILRGDIDEFPMELNDIRGDLLDMRLHYQQLIDVSQELVENENNFFKEENLRYFRLFTDRVMRLKDTVTGLRDFVAQLRDLVQSQLTVRQNKIMTLLTLITSIFLPLTLIAGWYGMNFRYMPELDKPYSYPIVIGVCLLIVVGCIVWFKKKKWM